LPPHSVFPFFSLTFLPLLFPFLLEWARHDFNIYGYLSRAFNVLSVFHFPLLPFSRSQKSPLLFRVKLSLSLLLPPLPLFLFFCFSGLVAGSVLHLGYASLFSGLDGALICFSYFHRLVSPFFKRGIFLPPVLPYYHAGIFPPSFSLPFLPVFFPLFSFFRSFFFRSLISLGCDSFLLMVLPFFPFFIL